MEKELKIFERSLLEEKKIDLIKSFVFVWAISCMIFSLCANAQPGEIKFKTLSSGDGLSGSLAWSIAQDHHGFIWIGTSEGLNVYNGYEFKTFRHHPKDSASIGHNFIYKLLFDKKNRLWMATPRGIERYDGISERFFHYKPSLKPGTISPNIFWLYEDQHSRIWAGTSDGVNIFNEATSQFESHPLPEYLKITSGINTLLQDKRGRYWVGTDEGLYLWDAEKKSAKKITGSNNSKGNLPSDKINTIFEDRRGNIWTGTSGGLGRFDEQTLTFTYFTNDPGNPNTLSHNRVSSIAEDHDGNLWVGTYDGGLNKFSLSSRSFQRFLRDSKDSYSLADNAVKEVMVDENGGIWVTTFRGVSFTDHYQMQFSHLENQLYDPKSLTDNFVTALFDDREGNIWSGNRHGISLLEQGKNSFTHFRHDPSDPSTIADGAILNISEDAEGNLWCITHTGFLNKFDRKKNVFTRFLPDPQDPGSIRPHTDMVYCTRDGNVWLKSVDGISKYNKEKNNFTHLGKPGPSEQEQVSHILEDSKENFWVANPHGLYWFEVEKGIFSLKHSFPDSLGPFNTSQIYEDSNQNIWIGSDNKGLLFYDSGADIFKYYSGKEGFPDVNVKGIQEDEKGNFWISSNNGLFHYDPAKQEFREYGLSDGLKNKEFNQGASAKDKDGILYFGGRNGITVFHPKKIISNPHPPKVVISDFRLFNKTVPIGENSPLKASVTGTDLIEISYKQNVFSFEFVALNYNSPEKNKYAYKMEGFDEDWIYSGTRRHATYTNLPPGKTYTFKVKASNNDNTWNEEGASVKVYIVPPFWATWWFYTLVTCVAVISLYSLYLWRVRQLREQRRELERMVKERTEEVEKQKDELAAHASELKTANREIKLKNKKIRRQANKLKIIDQLKSQFLANISHEFRTPLTLILVPLEEMISAREDHPETRSQLSVIDRNARRLLQLINQLLDLSKIENGNVPLDLTRQNFVSFVRNISQTFNPLAAKQKINYRFFSPAEEILMDFDPGKAENIIYNLISNAFKFTPDGGNIEVSVARREITESEESSGDISHGNYVQITVNDSGSGIGEEHLPYIFDRFYQAGGSDARKSVGTGIGLALTKEMTELHGGKISVKSQKGKGTTFIVLLPVKEPVPGVNFVSEGLSRFLENPLLPKNEETEYAVSTELPAGENSPLLLIVEDNPDLRHQIRKILSRNYRVEEAENGIEGWEKACELMPDLIISDIMMPGQDGLALCNQLKSDPATSHIPTILLSARIDSEEEGLRIGADDYITKPFNAKVLAFKVRNLLDTRENFRKLISRELGVSSVTTVPETAETINEQDASFIEEATGVALKYLSDPDIKMETIYRELGMSRSLVYRKLKSLTGLGPNEFLRQVRLNKASQFLKEGKLTVSEVMYRTGFNHRSYFVKCFKNEFGHLPSEHLEVRDSSSLQAKPKDEVSS